MGSLGLRVRNGDRDILVPIRHAFGGLYWGGRRRVVSLENERGGSQSRLGGGGWDAVCNGLEIGSFRNDDLLFCPCLNSIVIQKLKAQSLKQDKSLGY